MTSDLDNDKESPTELRRQRRFRIHLWWATGCYLLANAALYLWGGGSSPWRLVWAVLPVLFMVWIVIVIALRVPQLDEYQRKLQFPGLAVGFTVTVFAAITIGTLGSAGIAVPAGGWPVALLGVIAWAVTNIVVKARM